MSYILDALKRADAERERGLVPGLHSQSAAALPQGAPATRRPTLRPVLWIALAALLVVAAAAGWWLTRQRGAAPPAAPTPAPASASSAPVVQAPAPPVPPPLPILAPPPPAPPPAAPPAAVAPSAPSAPAAAAPGSARVRSLNELPPEVRAQLPQVGISGGTYSSNPEHRMLIANGKVVHEGEEIAPGLRLESIAPGKAVLNHQGTRYSVGY